ncbi:hypothetical protein A2U01_0060495, partial [Trifolium medium]|nr:hypothetical protein [Trifolium medium]
RNEVMEAYFQALNELTQEIPSNREDCRADEDNFGVSDSGFDAEDENANVNCGESADYDDSVYEEDESLGGELDVDESDSGYSSDDLSESGNTVA